MAIYFQAINDNNKVQIDDTTSRLHLTRSSLLTACGNKVGSNTGAKFSQSEATNMGVNICIDIPLASNETLMSFRLLDENFSNGRVCFVVLRWTNTSYRVWMYSMQSGGTSEANLWSVYAPKIKCYFWGTGETSSDKFGLQIFDENGIQIFHSSDYVMDIIGKYESTISQYKDHRSHPTFNLNVSTSKSLLVASMAQAGTYYMGHTNRPMEAEGYSLNGLYSADGVYKMYAFYVNFWYRYSHFTVSQCASCLRNLIYIVDVPD